MLPKTNGYTKRFDKTKYIFLTKDDELLGVKKSGVRSAVILKKSYIMSQCENYQHGQNI